MCVGVSLEDSMGRKESLGEVGAGRFEVYENVVAFILLKLESKMNCSAGVRENMSFEECGEVLKLLF